MINDATARGFLPKGTYGFMEQYMAVAHDQTDAPDVYHLYTGLSVLAAGAPVDLFMIGAGAAKIRPNLFTVLIGRSVTERKSTALNIAEAVIEASDLSERVIRPQDASSGGLVEELGSRPATCLINDELSVFLTSTKSTYAEGVTKLLTTAYDGKALHRLIRKKDGIKFAKDYSVNFLGASSKRWFLTSVTPADVSGGWLARWVFVHAERSWFLDVDHDEMAQQRKLAQIIELGNRLTHFHTACPTGIIGMSPGAKKVYKDYGVYMDQRQRASTEERMGPLGRAQLIALKFAMLLAADRSTYGHTPSGPLVIEQGDMWLATNLADWHAQSVEEVLVEVHEGDINKQKAIILDFIRSKKGQGVGLGQISLECRLPLLKKQWLDRLEMLQLEGLVQKMVSMHEDMWRLPDQDRMMPTNAAPPVAFPSAPNVGAAGGQGSNAPVVPEAQNGGAWARAALATAEAPPTASTAPAPTPTPSQALFPMYSDSVGEDDDDDRYF